MRFGYVGWSAFLVGITLAFFTVAFAQSPGGRPIEPGQQPPETPRPAATVPAVSHGVTYTARDTRGRKSWQIHARALIYHEDHKEAEGVDVRCVFFGNNELPIMFISAPAAVMNTETLDVAFRGTVSGRTPSGDTLRIGRLWYNGKTTLFFGNGGVRITHNSIVLTGDRISGRHSLNAATLSGNVRAEKRPVAQ